MRTAGLTLTASLLGLAVVGGSSASLRARVAERSGDGKPAALPPPSRNRAMPRTADGRPDLQGNWTNATITPLERMRPNTPLVMTEEAAPRRRARRPAALEAPRSAERSESRRAAGRRRSCARARTPSRPISSAVAGPAPAWSAATTRSGSIRAIACCASTASRAARSSSIRRTAACPATPTKRARGWRRPRRFARRRAASSIIPSCGRSAERCITSFGNNAGPPMLPNYFYNNSYTIVQSKDTVMILTEMVHDARVVRMNGTHPPASLRKWFGDSIGRWEGDTLVIETTNFHPSHGFRGSWENLKITERHLAPGREDAELSLHRRGSDDVHRAVHGRARVQRDGAGRNGLRVRVPRSQLRPRRRDERRARAGTRSGEEEVAAVGYRLRNTEARKTGL